MTSARDHVVVLSGAGISAESGLQTFRDSDGLWEGYDIYEVATPEAWAKNAELVQQFYNERRKAVIAANPNAAHLALADLEKHFQVSIITQNIDDLHERAGSSSVLHLHGNIRFARSSIDDNLLYPIQGTELQIGEKCELGSQLRPHVVWFGESVPAMEEAIAIASRATVLLIVGTSLQVYPAADLLNCVPRGTPIVVADRILPASTDGDPRVRFIAGQASQAVPEFCQELRSARDARANSLD